MNEKQNLNELDLIKQMVNESQGLFNSSRSFFILWGLAIPFATILTLLFDINNLDNYIYIIWIGTTIPCSITSFIIGLKSSKPHKTIFTGLYGVVWISIGTANLIIFTLLFTNILPLSLTLGFLSILLGIGYIIGGYMQKSRILKISAAFWYILAVVMFLVENNYSGYIMGIASLFLTFLPGVLMRKDNE